MNDSPQRTVYHRDLLTCLRQLADLRRVSDSRPVRAQKVVRNLNSQKDTKKSLTQEQWMKSQWNDFWREVKSFVGTQRALQLPYLPAWGGYMLWAWMGAQRHGRMRDRWSRFGCPRGRAGWRGSGRPQVQDEVPWPSNHPPPVFSPHSILLEKQLDWGAGG